VLQLFIDFEKEYNSVRREFQMSKIAFKPLFVKVSGYNSSENVLILWAKFIETQVGGKQAG
jgi:hypothetical protein